MPAGSLKKELLDYVDQIPTYVQQLQFTVKNPTVGKAATFTKVDAVIQETKNCMNCVSKVVSTCFECANKVDILTSFHHHFCLHLSNLLGLSILWIRISILIGHEHPVQHMYHIILHFVSLYLFTNPLNDSRPLHFRKLYTYIPVFFSLMSSSSSTSSSSSSSHRHLKLTHLKKENNFRFPLLILVFRYVTLRCVFLLFSNRL